MSHDGFPTELRKTVLVLVSLLSGVLGARELFVAADASPGGDTDGTAARPFGSIAHAVKTARSGDVITVRGGVYREQVRLRSGSAGQPIVLRAAPDERVLISGSRPVTGWRPFRDRVWVTRLAWRPTRLLVDWRDQPLAREPNEGWWQAGKVETDALMDPAHLSGLGRDLTRAEVYVWTQRGNMFFTVPVTEFDETKGLVRVEVTSKHMTLSDGDKYWLQNQVSLIDRPGEWAVAEEAAGSYAVYFRPVQASDLERTEAPIVERPVVELQSGGHVRLEGLEIAGGITNGLYFAASEGIDVRHCILHSNGRNGIAFRSCSDFQVNRSSAWHNTNGITLSYCRGAELAQNDVGWNRVDGLTLAYECEGIVVRRNYIHHHQLWGHPDNAQMFRGVRNVRFIENLLLCAGQAVMMEQTTDCLFRGNTVVGTSANMLIFGHGSASNCRVERNTLAFAGYSCLSLTGSDYSVTENVIMTGHPGLLFGVKGVRGYTGNRNLLWTSAGSQQNRPLLASDGGWHSSLREFQDATGQDGESVFSDPQFANAPVLLGVLDHRRLCECTRERWFLRGGTSGFEPGDHVEVNFDGVLRRVRTVAESSVTVAPPLDEAPVKAWLVANWKDADDLRLDLSLVPNSVGTRLNADRGPVGSAVDISAYRRGDFDGDGLRDIPALPPGFPHARLTGSDEGVQR